MNEQAWSEIKPYEADWCKLDSFDGDGKRRIEEKRYWLLWPDGLASQHDVKLDRYNIPSSDWGRPIQIPAAKAYVELIEHGATARIYLAENHIKIMVLKE